MRRREKTLNEPMPSRWAFFGGRLVSRQAIEAGALTCGAGRNPSTPCANLLERSGSHAVRPGGCYGKSAYMKETLRV